MDELNNRDMSDIPTDRHIAMVIKQIDTLKADETQSELLGEVEWQPLALGEQTTWKICLKANQKLTIILLIQQ